MLCLSLAEAFLCRTLSSFIHHLNQESRRLLSQWLCWAMKFLPCTQLKYISKLNWNKWIMSIEKESCPNPNCPNVGCINICVSLCVSSAVKCRSVLDVSCLLPSDSWEMFQLLSCKIWWIFSLSMWHLLLRLLKSSAVCDVFFSSGSTLNHINLHPLLRPLWFDLFRLDRRFNLISTDWLRPQQSSLLTL